MVISNEDDPLAAEVQQHHEAFTQIETSVANVHDSLKKTVDFQVPKEEKKLEKETRANSFLRTQMLACSDTPSHA